MRNIIRFSIVLVFACHVVNGQSFLNLDFEYTVYNHQPRKWVSEGEGRFSVATVGNVSHSGNRSLHIQMKDAQTYTFLSLPGAQVAGKRIEVAGYIRRHSKDSLNVLLAFKDPIASPIIFPADAPESDQWNSLHWESSFPASYSSDRLLVAVIVMGSGDVWLDNFSIKIDGQSVGNDAPDFSEPLRSEIDVINERSIPINVKFQNLNLKKITGDAQIFGLGENSHGSASIFKLKNSLVKTLIEDEEFTLFALESPAIEADSINTYVMNGIGSPQKMLDHLVYASWRTQEFLDLIEWLREHNKTAKVKVQFRGIDMQDGTAALHALATWFKKHSEYQRVIYPIDSMYKNATSGKIEWRQLEHHVKSLVEKLDQLSVGELPGVSTLELINLRRYAMILSQCISLKSGTGDREKFLADNVEFLYRNADPGTRIVVSADNSHVMRASGKMGYFLSQKFGKRYLALGSTFVTGNYSAYGDKPFYEAHPPYVGTYEYLFSKCRYKNFMLDLRQKELTPIFSAAAGFRSIGSRPQEMTQFPEIVLRDNFDIIVNLEKSEYANRK